MKDELGVERGTVTEFVGLRPKTYCYLIEGGKSNKKAKMCNETRA